jgi:hypothetical protein
MLIDFHRKLQIPKIKEKQMYPRKMKLPRDRLGRDEEEQKAARKRRTALNKINPKVYCFGILFSLQAKSKGNQYCKTASDFEISSDI